MQNTSFIPPFCAILLIVLYHILSQFPTFFRQKALEKQALARVRAEQKAQEKELVEAEKQKIVEEQAQAEAQASQDNSTENNVINVDIQPANNN